MRYVPPLQHALQLPPGEAMKVLPRLSHGIQEEERGRPVALFPVGRDELRDVPGREWHVQVPKRQRLGRPEKGNCHLSSLYLQHVWIGSPVPMYQKWLV